MIRVFIADDHPLIRDGLRRLMEESVDIGVVGEATDGEEVLRRAATESWDVLLLDLSMPTLGGFEVLRALKKTHPRLPVLVLTMHAEQQYAARMFAAGAAGFLTKGGAPSVVLQAIRKVVRGGRYVTPEQAELLVDRELAPDRPLHEALTHRQLEVLLLIGQGASPSEVAHRLALRASTVSTHLHHIKQKLGAHTIGDLAQYALRNGLVQRG